MSGTLIAFGASAPDDDTRLRTSADGRLGSPRRLSVIIIGGALAIPGTSSAQPNTPWSEEYEHTDGPTTGGLTFETTSTTSEEPPTEQTGLAVSELRRLSGLTWSQLGQLFGVSRRSVHFWASGKAMNATNLERLMRTLEVIRDSDRGDAHTNRAALFERAEGVSPFDLLVEQRYDDARAVLGRGRGRHEVARTPLSAEARADRMPPSPAELVDAKHDPIPSIAGPGRAARTVRNKRRGSDR